MGSFRKALESVRAGIIRMGYTQDEVTLNSSNAIKDNNTNICLYISGFSIPQTQKPGYKHPIMVVEFRQKVDTKTTEQYEDIAEEACELAFKLRDSKLNGVSSVPLDDAVEGKDQK